MPLMGLLIDLDIAEGKIAKLEDIYWQLSW